MLYSFTCSQGHEPMTFTAEAENDEEALQKIMDQTQPHVAEKHSEMANMSEEEAKNMITSMWKKEESSAMA